ncbi:MAG TPA: tetratricopeptide repeat protein, partial [Bryobacteraceae bacterium]
LTDARTVRLKDSSLIPIPADGAGLQSMLANSLAALFPAHSTLVTRAHGQTTSNSRAYAQYVQGEGALNNRNYDEGVSYFQKAVDLDPAFALARAKLALAHVRSYLQTKYPVSLAKADAEAHRAAEAGITPDVLLVQALIRDATGDTSGAIALFRDYQRAEPDDVEAYGLLADTLNKAGRPQEAEEAFLSAIRMRPGYWPTYQRLGVFYFGRHQFDKAADRFLTGIGIAPDVPSLHYNLGAVYFSQDRWHEAGIEFEKSLAIRPTALAYSNLGTVRFYEGKYREASQQFEQATKLQPNNAFNWGNLGDALWQLPNERDRARKAFAQAAVLASEQLGLNGADADLRRSYAVSLVKLGRAPEAFAQIERVRQQHPADASVEFYTGRVYACAGNRSEALKALKSAVALGYSVGEIAREPDFAALRSDPVFQQLIGKHPNKDTNKE